MQRLRTKQSRVQSLVSKYISSVPSAKNHFQFSERLKNITRRGLKKAHSFDRYLNDQKGMPVRLRLLVEGCRRRSASFSRVVARLVHNALERDAVFQEKEKHAVSVVARTEEHVATVFFLYHMCHG